MTNEEAIEQLEHIKPKMNELFYHLIGVAEKSENAINIAVEALRENTKPQEENMNEEERKMMAYLAMILSKIGSGQQLNYNEIQSLDNIASGLGAYSLAEDEFRY